MRYDPAHKAKTHALIVDEASRALRKDGAHATSLASVMKRAGLTHGGFYAHFSSREDMLVAAIERCFADSRARWKHEGSLRNYIAWYLSKEHRDDRENGCVIAALGGEQLPDACRKAFAEGSRQLVALLATETDDAQALLSELVGALTLARIEPDKKRSNAILAASLAKHL